MHIARRRSARASSLRRPRDPAAPEPGEAQVAHAARLRPAATARNLASSSRSSPRPPRPTARSRAPITSAFVARRRVDGSPRGVDGRAAETDPYSRRHGARARPPRRTGVGAGRLQRRRPAADAAWPGPGGPLGRTPGGRDIRRGPSRRWSGPARPRRPCWLGSDGPRWSRTGWRRSATRSGTARRPSGRRRPTPPTVPARPTSAGTAWRAASRCGTSSPASASARSCSWPSGHRTRPGGPPRLDAPGARAPDPVVAHAGTNTIVICHLLGLVPVPWSGPVHPRPRFGHPSEAMPTGEASPSACPACPTWSTSRGPAHGLTGAHGAAAAQGGAVARGGRARAPRPGTSCSSPSRSMRWRRTAATWSGAASSSRSRPRAVSTA